jgi:hypothetical protein
MCTLPQPSADRLELSGIWRAEDDGRGLLVRIEQSGSNVVATLLDGGDCPHGGTRASWFRGRLDGSRLEGRLTACVLSEALVTGCKFRPTYETDFIADVRPDAILGKRRGLLWSAKECRRTPRSCPWHALALTRLAHDPLKIDRDLDKLNPCFALRIQQLVARANAAGIKAAVFEGYRSPERQQWLYAQGRTRPGRLLTQRDGVTRHSEHASGVAADIYIRNEQGAFINPADVPDDVWNRLAAIGIELGLTWGGDRLPLLDRPHFEAPELRQASDDRLAACREALQRA